MLAQPHAMYPHARPGPTPVHHDVSRPPPVFRGHVVDFIRFAEVRCRTWYWPVGPCHHRMPS
jgi:hypothetical protein